jgi:putative PIN family toxin of toxin-antitoxin system
VRLVLDTNIVVAALLWRGPPCRLFEACLAGQADCFTSSTLLAELGRVLRYPKFAARITAMGSNVEKLIEQYTQLADRVIPLVLPRITRDPDDDHVIACALAARADLIVSGDADLLDLGAYQGMRIVSAAAALAHMTQR